MRYKIRERRQAKASTIYLVVKYAKWCIREYKWTGKYGRDKTGERVPLVYHWTDHNGSRDEWLICPITETTSGEIFSWSIDKRQAETTKEWRIIYERMNLMKEMREGLIFL